MPSASEYAFASATYSGANSEEGRWPTRTVPSGPPEPSAGSSPVTAEPQAVRAPPRAVAAVRERRVRRRIGAPGGEGPGGGGPDGGCGGGSALSAPGQQQLLGAAEDRRSKGADRADED